MHKDTMEMRSDENWEFKKLTERNISNIVFLEWKYFSFTADGIGGFFSYSVGNPQNLLGLNRCIITYAIYYEDEETMGCEELSKKECSLDGKRKWIFGRGYLEKMNEDIWVIHGDNEDVTWDLTFFKVAGGGQILTEYDSILNINIWMNWKSLFNSAKVSGRIILKKDKKTFKLDCLGYYDTNFGHWIPSSCPWNWGHCIGLAEQRITSFSFGERRDKQQKVWGKIFFSIDDKTIEFDHRQYTLEYDRTPKIPDSFELTAKNEDKNVHLCTKFKAKKHFSLDINAFNFIPMLELHILKGTFQVEAHLPEGHKISFSSTGLWEFPKKPKYLFRR